MPTRVIRDGILTSPRVDKLSEPAEVFYRRLMSAADDHGRYWADPTMLISGLYPRRIKTVTEKEVSSHLAECQAAALVMVYRVNGELYLQMLDFGQRVQSKSKFPEPTVEHGEVPASTVIPRLDEDEDEDVGEDGRGKARTASAVSPEALIASYHKHLPACQRIAVLTPARRSLIRKAEGNAKRVCQSRGWTYGPDFWEDYFRECATDPWRRGEVPNPKNAGWKQSLDVLLSDKQFAQVMDRALGGDA